MNEIKKLYDIVSKHSHYQLLPKSVENIVGEVQRSINRFENERFEYITQNVNLQNLYVLDIGANTGFFSISSIEHGAKEIIAYEGNQIHSSFLSLVSNHLNLNIKTVSEYYYNNDNLDKNFDLIFLLNVVHHVGDDFQKGDMDILSAKNKMIEMINQLSKNTRYLVFQMGYCWKGNTELLLFENGTKSEMIDFISSNTSDFWDILKIGVLTKDLKYQDINDENSKKFKELGEFGNRPLFILQSKNYL